MRKRAIVALVCIGVMSTLSACKKAKTDKDSLGVVSQEQAEEVIIPAIFLQDTITGVRSNEELVNEFNKEYKGKYRVEVEWMAGDESDYRSKLKLLNSTNELPAILTDVGFDASFFQLLVEHDRIVNLKDYIQKDESLAESFDYEAIQSCALEDGSIYLFPLVNQLYYSGIFYNKELFERAGIMEFPETWESFFEACDKLMGIGITPLSLHTIGTAWVPMLYATAYMGSTIEGTEFMNQQFPDTYDAEVFRDAMEFMKRLFTYSTEDAIDGDYDTAAEHFFEEDTAMFANGEWMSGYFYNESIASKGFSDKIGFHSFPEQVLVGSVEMTGWSISKDHSEEVIQGAIEFMKFRMKRDVREYSDILKNYKNGIGEHLMVEYISQLETMKTEIPNYQLKWNPIIQNEIFVDDLPSYLKGTMELNELIEKLNDAVARYDVEQ